jgi:Nif-specific regulatory protein
LSFFKEKGLMTQIEQREGHAPSFRANGLGIAALELQAIYEISQIVGSAIYLDKALSQILHVLHTKLSMERATLVLLNETDRSLSIMASYGLTNIEEKWGVFGLNEAVCRKILQTCSPFVISDIHSEPVYLDKIKSTNFLSKDEFSLIGVPIILREEPVGVLAVDRLFDREISLEEDIHFLTMLAIMIAQFLKLHRTVCRNEKTLMEENRSLRAEIQRLYSRRSIIGMSKAIYEVLERCPRSLRDLEREEVEAALRRHGWVQARAARDLGLTQRQIGYRIKKYGLHPPESE